MVKTAILINKEPITNSQNFFNVVSYSEFEYYIKLRVDSKLIQPYTTYTALNLAGLFASQVFVCCPLLFTPA